MSRELRLLIIITLTLVAGSTVACRNAPVRSTATPTVTTTSVRTASPTPSLEAGVSAAYLAYWDAYSKALLNLDPSLIQGVAADDEAQRIKDEITALQRQGVAQRVVVKHDFSVVTVSAGAAVIVDRYVDKSFYVNPSTKEPQSADVAGETITDNYELKRTDNGGWVVVRSRRQG